MRQVLLLDVAGVADVAGTAALRDRMVAFFLQGARR